jgi:hypothetical protein
MIVALNNYWRKGEYMGAMCGKKVRIKNTGIHPDGGPNEGVGNIITATVQDTCPECDRTHIGKSVSVLLALAVSAFDGEDCRLTGLLSSCLDLSPGAWDALTDNSPPGIIDIQW